VHRFLTCTIKQFVHNSWSMFVVLKRHVSVLLASCSNNNNYFSGSWVVCLYSKKEHWTMRGDWRLLFPSAPVTTAVVLLPSDPIVLCPLYQTMDYASTIHNNLESFYFLRFILSVHSHWRSLLALPSPGSGYCREEHETLSNADSCLPDCGQLYCVFHQETPEYIYWCCEMGTLYF
jgi:hypothetical protein